MSVLAPRYRSGLAGAQPWAPALDKNTRIVATESLRVDRLRAREALRGFSTLERVRRCGHAVGGSVRVGVSVGPGGVQGTSLSGVLACGKLWVCPVCSGRISAHRTLDLEHGLTRWLDGGNQLGLLTLTMRHTRNESLSAVWDAALSAWRRMVRSGTYRRVYNRLGVRGYHRTVEVTHGSHGWHVHFHVLLFLDPFTPYQRDDGHELVRSWLDSVTAEGRTAVQSAQDFSLIGRGERPGQALAAYVLKATSYARERSISSIALEVGRSDLKRARDRSSLTPFQLLQRIVDGTATPRHFALWAEWEQAAAGRRAHVWSRGLRDRLGLGEEIADEDLVLDDGPAVDLVEIPAQAWRALSSDPESLAALWSNLLGLRSLDVALCALSAKLDQLGITHRVLWPVSAAGA